MSNNFTTFGGLIILSIQNYKFRSVLLQALSTESSSMLVIIDSVLFLDRILSSSPSTNKNSCDYFFHIDDHGREICEQHLGVTKECNTGDSEEK